MSSIYTFIQTHLETFVVLALGTGWVGNSISSYVVQTLGALNKQGAWWSFVRFLHGIINQIDPTGATTSDEKTLR